MKQGNSNKRVRFLLNEPSVQSSGLIPRNAEFKKASVEINKMKGLGSHSKDMQTGWIDPLMSKRRHSIQRQFKIPNIVKPLKSLEERVPSSKGSSLVFQIKTRRTNDGSKDDSIKSVIQSSGNWTERVQSRAPRSPTRALTSKGSVNVKERQCSPRKVQRKEDQIGKPKKALEGMAGVIRALAENIKIRVDRRLAEERFERSLKKVRDIRRELSEVIESRRALGNIDKVGKTTQHTLKKPGKGMSAGLGGHSRSTSLPSKGLNILKDSLLLEGRPGQASWQKGGGSGRKER